jgi:hypothetical protein
VETSCLTSIAIVLGLLLSAAAGGADVTVRASAWAAHAAQDSSWQEHARAADSAAAHRDWARYLHHARVVDSLLHHHPRAAVGLARGYAQRGDTAVALGVLRALVAAGISRDVTGDSLLRPLVGSSQWAAIVRGLAANAAPRGRARQTFALSDSGFAAEDIAYDARRDRYLLSSIARRSIMVVEGGGREHTLAASSPGAPLWAVLALGVDSARDRLWATTIGNDRIPGLAPGARPRASILRLDLATGRIARRFDLPDDGVPREPGDLVVAPDGDVFVTDGRTGAIYAIRLATDALDTLVAAGVLTGPQQPVVAHDGRTLIVPDYVRGLASVDRSSGAVRWLANPPTIAVNGIDGLQWWGPHMLIAVQNGVAPARIVRFSIDEARGAVTRSEVLAQGGAISDPTHGIIVGDEYVLIAYSGGGALLPDGSVRPGAEALPPTVARLRLAP